MPFCERNTEVKLIRPHNLCVRNRLRRDDRVNDAKAFTAVRAFRTINVVALFPERWFPVFDGIWWSDELQDEPRNSPQYCCSRTCVSGVQPEFPSM